MDQFLANCGAVSLEVTVERAGAAPQAASRLLQQPYLVIGRDPRSELPLDDPNVSRRHAYLQVVGGRLFCIDLDSRTGVHWPSGRRAMGWVDWGEPLRVGTTVLRVLRPRPAEDAGALPSEVDRAITRPAAQATIEVIEGTDRPVRWEMKRLLALVGGAAPCKVRLRDPRVSRFHCALVRGPLGVWAVDLLSRDGTWVNGSVVPWSRLADGDRLQVGPYTLRVWYEQPADHRIAERTPAPVALSVFQTAPPTSTRAGADHSLLLPVINEFNRMQQQMLEQFHQTTLMMAEMFSTLHREQMGLVREELGQLRRLTQELQDLRTERARLALEAPDAAAAQAPPSDAAEGRPAEDPVPKAPPDEATPAGSSGADRAADAAAARVPEPVPVTPAVHDVADVHDWLNRRIASLEEERSGRWQKFLQFITGGNRS